MRIATLTSLVILASCFSPYSFAAAAGFSGTYRVNGQDAKLSHLTAMPIVKGEGCMFSDDALGVLFSEKDIPVGPNAKFNDTSFHAQMRQFGDAVGVRLCFKKNAWIVEDSNYYHSALKPAGGTWVDQLKVEGMTVANGEYSGHLVSIKDAKIMGQPLELSITFHTPKP